MLRRLFIVLLMLLFPLQWSAAQGHELVDDAGVLSAVAGHGAAPTKLVSHGDEPGGGCEFHELSQQTAAATSDDDGWPAGRSPEGWKSGLLVAAPEAGRPNDIDRPKWVPRGLFAANS